MAQLHDCMADYTMSPGAGPLNTPNASNFCHNPIEVDQNVILVVECVF